MRIASDNFTIEECELLCEMIHRQFGIKYHVWVTKDTGAPRIHFLKESMPLLRELVMPHLTPSMWHKFGVGRRIVSPRGSRV